MNFNEINYDNPLNPRSQGDWESQSDFELFSCLALIELYNWSPFWVY